MNSKLGETLDPRTKCTPGREMLPNETGHTIHNKGKKTADATTVMNGIHHKFPNGFTAATTITVMH